MNFRDEQSLKLWHALFERKFFPTNAFLSIITLAIHISGDIIPKMIAFYISELIYELNIFLKVYCNTFK